CPFRDVSRAEADDHVVGLHIGSDYAGQFVSALYGGSGAMAPALQPFDQRSAVHAFNRLLTRRIDGCGIDDIGVVERLLELVHQIAKASKTVRLDHGDDTPPASGTLQAFAGGGKDSANFDRVMAVIVDDARNTLTCWN